MMDSAAALNCGSRRFDSPQAGRCSHRQGHQPRWYLSLVGGNPAHKRMTVCPMAISAARWLDLSQHVSWGTLCGQFHVVPKTTTNMSNSQSGRRRREPALKGVTSFEDSDSGT